MTLLSPKRFVLSGLEAYEQNRGVCGIRRLSLLIGEFIQSDFDFNDAFDSFDAFGFPGREIFRVVVHSSSGLISPE